jgi:hypothetical protein
VSLCEKSDSVTERIFQAVEEQRGRLLNVLGAVQCVRIAVDSGPPAELGGAIELVEDYLQDAINGLERLTIERKLREAAND